MVGGTRRQSDPRRGSDNGPQYTATATVLYAHELGLVPIRPLVPPLIDARSTRFAASIRIAL